MPTMPKILRSGRMVCAMLAIMSTTLAFSATAGSRSARSLVTQKIDNNARITLAHNVRPELNAKTDLGPVEDTMSVQLHLVLQRSPEQQADLTTLIEHQHQASAAEFHKWLTPEQFGERFGASEQDVTRITDWLESRGFTVKSVNHGNSMIDFSGTAGAVREAFHTQLHSLEVNGKRVYANDRDPQIPAALAPVIGGITGLQNIPLRPNHTQPARASYDKATHTWQRHALPGTPEAAQPEFADGQGDYYISPQDYYTIYNVNPVYTAGYKGSGLTVAVIEQSDMAYGTVTGTTASGGDVATFRSLFGVAGTLSMEVLHGGTGAACSDPGVVSGDETEATLDAEWANALAPAAKLLYMSCDGNSGGVIQSLAAVIDNNLADTMSMSYGNSELNFTSSSDYMELDTLYAQAAAQGESVFVSTGDSGSDVADQNQGQGAVNGLNVSALSASPYVTATGGTDFQDYYDANSGGQPQSKYWSNTNSTFYGDATGYVPEMSWNFSCASSMLAEFESQDTPAAFCATNPSLGGGYSLVLNVVGGSGGFSTHYAVPSYQSGITGYSGTMRAQPDMAMFASPGLWTHGLIYCDSIATNTSCDSSADFAVAGGTSFVAPAMAGIGGLLVNYTGTRQGVLNYALYALAKTQYATNPTGCYSNGQTNNTGVTTSVPQSTCIFNDVTTGNNDEGCTAGGTQCFVNSGQTYGVLSTKGASSLVIGYPSTVGYDEVSGVGTLNVNNLLTKWNTAFTSKTVLTASPTSITTAQSTTLSATVTGGTPAGFTGKAPTVNGKINFLSGTTNVGTCTLASGTCSASVTGATLGAGSHSITAMFVGSNAYPTSTSTATTVTVTGSSVTTTTSVAATPSSAVHGQSVSLKATVTASSGTATGMVTFTSAGASLGSCTLASGTCTASTAALPVGTDTVAAAYGGASGFGTSTGATTVTVSNANTLTTVTATPSTITAGSSTTLKATVAVQAPGSGTATGTVTFKHSTTTLGSCTLGSGTCSVSTTALPSGSDVVTASYSGASGFGTSSGTVTVTVTSGTATTTTKFTATPNPLVVGQTVALKATVTASSGTATGKVNFAVGTVALGSCTLASGACTFSASTNGQTPGTYPIVATYAGASGFSGSASPAVNVVLNKANTSVTVTASPNPVTPPAAATLTATVKRVAPGAGVATGTVTFSVGTTVIATVGLNGSGVAKVTAPTNGVAAGSYPVTAKYIGDSSDNTSSGMVTVTVN
jgi:hypothetical protein